MLRLPFFFCLVACGVFLLAPVEESDKPPSCAGELSFRGDVPEVKDNAEEARDSVEAEQLSLPNTIEELCM